MKTQDFDKVWKDAKKQLSKASKEAMSLLKKGEGEIIKASGKAKVNFDIGLLKLKREQLFYVIGKEAVKLFKNSKVTNATISKLLKEIKNIEGQISRNKILLRKKS